MIPTTTRIPSGPPRHVRRPGRSATYQRLATAPRRRSAAACRASVFSTRSTLWVRALRCIGLAD